MRSLFSWYSKTLLNPNHRWWLILGSLIYLLSPIDISPDLIPLIGQVDDFVLLIMLFSGVLQLLATQQPQDLQQGFSHTEDNDSQDSSLNSQKPTTIDVDAIEIS